MHSLLNCKKIKPIVFAYIFVPDQDIDHHGQKLVDDTSNCECSRRDWSIPSCEPKETDELANWLKAQDEANKNLQGDFEGTKFCTFQFDEECEGWRWGI